MIRTPTAKPPTLFGDAYELVATLARLRPIALLGQALAVLFAVFGLHLVLPLVPLASVLSVSALAVVAALWRLRKARPVGETEAVLHVCFDILVLAAVLYFTGGAANPFITLLLVPVALVAATLSGRGIAVVTLLAMAAYGLLTFRNVPLGEMSMGAAEFRLHLVGMTVNFFVAVVLLAVFVGRMSAAMGAQRRLTAELRERALRDEGILAIATQAAEAAHHLNTPLSTLRTLLPEIRDGRETDVDLCADLDVMAQEVERCRGILRSMVDYGRHRLDGAPQHTTLGEYVDSHVDRFRLLHPDAQLALRFEGRLRALRIVSPPGLAHALLNLMQNALEASLQAAAQEAVELTVTVDAGIVEFAIGDHGRGFGARHAGALPGESSKAHGLGIGLALARSTVERLHGELHTTSGRDGTHVSVRVPLVENP